jgi:hypothetical protein
MSSFENPMLDRAVAKFLFVASKDEPDGIAKIYRAAALLLIGEDIDPALLAEAEKGKTIDDALYTETVSAAPTLAEIFNEHRR